MSAAASERLSEADAAAWGAHLADAYREIGERAMRDLPIYNEALAVEAIGFRVFDRSIIGIVLTPWFMNVVMPAPRDVGDAPGTSLRARLPVGEVDFTLGEVDGVGRIVSCSLFSPMFAFADMATARATAEAALAELMLPADREEVIRAADAPSAIDRRNFLRGVLTEKHG